MKELKLQFISLYEDISLVKERQSINFCNTNCGQIFSVVFVSYVELVSVCAYV